MVIRIKCAALMLIAAFGVWLTLQSGVEGSLFSSGNCAASRALLCVKR